MVEGVLAGANAKVPWLPEPAFSVFWYLLNVPPKRMVCGPTTFVMLSKKLWFRL